MNTLPNDVIKQFIIRRTITLGLSWNALACVSRKWCASVRFYRRFARRIQRAWRRHLQQKYLDVYFRTFGYDKTVAYLKQLAATQQHAFKQDIIVVKVMTSDNCKDPWIVFSWMPMHLIHPSRMPKGKVINGTFVMHMVWKADTHRTQWASGPASFFLRALDVIRHPDDIDDAEKAMYLQIEFTLTNDDYYE